MINIIAFDLLILSVDALNLLYYYFMFKMKIVELEVDDRARSSYDIIRKILEVHWRAKTTVIFYITVIITFTLFNLAYGIYEIFGD